MLQTALNDVKTRIRVGVDQGEKENLARIFDKLPQDVYGKKCPECGGSVLDNVCRNCGRSFTGQQRRKGLRMMLIGGILFLAGILLTYLTYNSSSGSMWLFYGPIILGAGFAVGGLIALISGKRV